MKLFTEVPRTSHGEDALAWQLRALGLAAPEREHRFDPSRRWRFDFAYPEQRIAIEVEGGSWVAGRHARGLGFEKDIEKYNAAAVAGWMVLRFTTAMVDDGRALATISEAIAARGIQR